MVKLVEVQSNGKNVAPVRAVDLRARSENGKPLGALKRKPGRRAEAKPIGLAISMGGPIDLSIYLPTMLSIEKRIN